MIKKFLQLDLAQTTFTTVLISILSFTFAIITSRVLGPDGRGELSIVQFTSILAMSLGQIGISNAIIFSFRSGRILRWAPNALQTIAIVAPATFLFSMLCIIGYNKEIDDEFTFLIAILAISSAISTHLTNCLQAKESLRAYNVSRIISPAITSLASFLSLAIFTHLSLHIFIAIQILSHMAAILYSITNALKCIFRDKDRPQKIWPPSEMRATAIYAIKTYSTSLVGLFIINIDKFILVKIVDSAMFGFYLLAYSLTRIIGSVQEAAAMRIFARFAGANPRIIGLKSDKAMRITFLPLVIIVFFSSFFYDFIITTLFGEKFRPVADLAIIFSFEAVIGGASWIIAQRFIAGGRPELVTYRQIIILIFIVLAVSHLPTSNTAIWAALVVLVASILRLALSVVMVRLTGAKHMPTFMPRLKDFRI